METLKQDVSKLYSITEYAKLMNVTRQTVYNWISDKEKKLNYQLDFFRLYTFYIMLNGKRYILF
jgi:predicted DNA-binding protein YlxM (UPF0122 family)